MVALSPPPVMRRIVMRAVQSPPPPPPECTVYPCGFHCVCSCGCRTQVGLPLRLRKFPSGVTVVQGSQFSDTQLCRNIEQLLNSKSSGSAAAAAAAAGSSSVSFVPGLGAALSAADVSAALLLPLTLAKEALLVAESAGVLCRDDGPEGLRFFRNFFKEAAPVVF